MSMGIQKTGHRNPRHGKSSCSYKGEHKQMEDNPILGADFGDDSDDCELAELHCELGMVEGQLCSIPFELFDLPDLREILSLDTWNSCLTEEERFHLSAYLPDMDQQTFYLTMNEIFDGSDLYFGNPLDVFFKRLKGGFYPPKVARFREGLQFIQRKKYYHSLRSYHDRMRQMFIDMKSLWYQCEMSSSVEERISIWKKKRKQRAINLLDLNKYPKDDHQLSEEISLDRKGMKSVGSKGAKDIFPSPSANRMKFAARVCSGKGVLMTKASVNGLFPNHNKKMIGSKISEKCQSVPKGVLKIMPKVSSVSQEQSELALRRSQPTFLVRTQGLQDIRFSSLPGYVHFPDAGGLYESPFVMQKVVGSGFHSTLNQQQDIQDHQESRTRISSLSDNSTRKLERQINPSLDDISVLGKHKFFTGDSKRDPTEEYWPPINATDASRYTFGSEILWSNLQKGTEDSSLRSLELYPFDICHGAEPHMALAKEKNITVYPRIVEAVPRTLTIGNGKRETLVASSSDLPRGESNISAKKSEKLLSKSSVSEGFKDETVLPLTYKRRKAVAKVNSLDVGKTIIAGAGLSPNQHFGEGAKAMKINFTGWKDMPLNNES